MGNGMAAGALVSLGILLFASVVVVMNADDSRSMEHAEFALTWIGRAIGTFVAAVAAVGALVAVLNASPLRRVFAFIPALLAGLLLIRVEWSVALSLGLIATAFLMRGIWLGPGRAAEEAEPA